MHVKNFNTGQRAYILNMYEGRGREPEVVPTTVDKVGRKYVTTVNGHRYEVQEYFEFGLVEAVNYGDRTFLCPSETDAKMYIEKCNLVTWIKKLNIYTRHSDYTLEQLRKVKDILDKT